MAFAVTNAITIKVIVATQERPEKRDMPQTPWPLVQPFASDVPTPTNKPDTTINQGDKSRSPASSSG